ncbi:hypothetical protein D3C86_1935220 [compost metagenome]
MASVRSFPLRSANAIVCVSGCAISMPVPRNLRVWGLAMPVTKGLSAPFSTLRMAFDWPSETKTFLVTGSIARPRGSLIP